MAAIVQKSCTKEKIIKKYEQVVRHDTIRLRETVNDTMLMHIDSIMAATLGEDALRFHINDWTSRHRG